MPAIVTAREGAERGIIDVMTPGAERRDAAFHRCRSLTDRWRGRGERRFRRGRAVGQNVGLGWWNAIAPWRILQIAAEIIGSFERDIVSTQARSQCKPLVCSAIQPSAEVRHIKV